MRKFECKFVIGIAFALFCPAVFAMQTEEVLPTVIAKLPMYVFGLFLLAVIVGAYSMRLRDKRRAPVGRLFGARETLLSGPVCPLWCVHQTWVRSEPAGPAFSRLRPLAK